MTTKFLQGCQNPTGCRRLAVETVDVRGAVYELCAYCAANVRDELAALEADR